MKSLRDIAASLRQSTVSLGVTRDALSGSAGITRRTLRLLLSGENDFKVTTLLAVADKLGLELVLVPRGAAVGLGAETAPAVGVKSLIESGQERLAARRNASR